MYGGHPTGRGSLHACRAGRWRPGNSQADSLQSSIPEPSSTRDPAATGANTLRSTAQSVARVVQERRRNAHRSSTEAHLDARNRPRAPSLASTPSRPSFRDWYKYGSRTRDTRFIRPLLYPSELTCGGMKQRNRAVLVCATPSGAQAGQVGIRTHYRCTIDVSTSTRGHGIRSPKSSIAFKARLLNVQNDETPVGSAFRGLLGEIVPGTAVWSAPQLERTQANASRLPRRAGPHRRDEHPLRGLAEPSAAACKS